MMKLLVLFALLAVTAVAAVRTEVEREATLEVSSIFYVVFVACTSMCKSRVRIRRHGVDVICRWWLQHWLIVSMRAIYDSH